MTQLILLASEVATMISGITAFLVFILLLVAVILFAKSKLMPSGKVSILINNEKTIDVNCGNTLLTTLSDQKIYLASACGGGGTCGQCKCQIIEGGGEILPTERPFFNRKKITENWRLSCQVKVKENMKIRVPEDVFGIKKWECTVASNENVSTYIKELVIEMPKGEKLQFEPGSYIQLDVPPVHLDFSSDLYNIPKKFRDDYDKFKIWDLKVKSDEPIFRAYSMANHPAEGNIVKLNIRLATPPWNRNKGDWDEINPGICSSYVFCLKPGDKVNIAGPFGDFHIKDTKREMIYIGGGAGMAPLRSQIFHLFQTKKTNRKVSYWYGARSKREIFYEEDFRKIEEENDNFKFHIALSDPLPEDNWAGFKGYIHQIVLDNYLKNHPEPEEVEYYLCGPPLMNQAVLKMLDELGVPESHIAFDDFGG